MADPNVKISGVIEGFYGTPWTHGERLDCIDFLHAHHMNTYVWAAKSEPRHRDRWSEPFTSVECEQFGELCSRRSGVNVSIALTPGSGAAPGVVVDKLRPAVECGVSAITLCVDDLPVLNAGREHRDIAHAILNAFGLPVWLVPTHYAGTESSPYLREVCDGLSRDVELMWTGRDVVNDSISVADARARVDATGGRAPLLWDNTPVNDGLMTDSLHLGPYNGRDPELRNVCAGVLLNPMEFMRASLPTLESAAAWLRGDDPVAAWCDVVDRDGWRMLAESTAFPGDAHWPGDAPSLEWWRSAAEVTDPTNDERLARWVDAVKLRARAVLAAHEIRDARSRTAPRAEVSRLFRHVVAWSRRPAHPLVLGEGTRVRPLATQDAEGEFVFDERSFATHRGLATSVIERLINSDSNGSQ